MSIFSRQHERIVAELRQENADLRRRLSIPSIPVQVTPEELRELVTEEIAGQLAGLKDVLAEYAALRRGGVTADIRSIADDSKIPTGGLS